MREDRQIDAQESSALSCRHFGRCGGCSSLALSPAQQLAQKATRVRARTAPWRGEVELEWQVAGSARFYRTKLLYPAQPFGRRGLALGLYARGTHDIERIRECQIQHPALTELGRRGEEVLRELGLRAWDERERRGDVRALHARITPDTGELLIGVVTREGAFPASELAKRLLDAANELPALRGPRPRAVGVVRNLNQAEGNALLGAHSVVLAGRAYQEDQQDGLRFRIGFGSFYQLHCDASEILYRPALALLGDVNGARIVDGYGGIGTFGLRLAAAGAAQVCIVEASASACADAEHNAHSQGLETDVQVVRAPFADASFAARPDVMIVDPPRAGLMQAGVARVLAAEPKRLLHVACSDASLARDLEGLAAGGYRVRAMRLVDLFPYTDHVEVLTLLTR